MRTFVYRARFEPGEKRGVIVVSFPDVPEAITEGKGEPDVMAQAQEALGLALLTTPTTGIADCCARAAVDQAAAPPRSVMNSRRFKLSIEARSRCVYASAK